MGVAALRADVAMLERACGAATAATAAAKTEAAVAAAAVAAAAVSCPATEHSSRRTPFLGHDVSPGGFFSSAAAEAAEADDATAAAAAASTAVTSSAFAPASAAKVEDGVAAMQMETREEACVAEDEMKRQVWVLAKTALAKGAAPPAAPDWDEEAFTRRYLALRQVLLLYIGLQH